MDHVIHSLPRYSQLEKHSFSFKKKRGTGCYLPLRSRIDRQINMGQFLIVSHGRSLSTARLSGKFDTHNLIGRFLVTLPDIDPEGLTSRRATTLKNRTSGDREEAQHGGELRVSRKCSNARKQLL